MRDVAVQPASAQRHAAQAVQSGRGLLVTLRILRPRSRTNQDNRKHQPARLPNRILHVSLPMRRTLFRFDGVFAGIARLCQDATIVVIEFAARVTSAELPSAARLVLRAPPGFVITITSEPPGFSNAQCPRSAASLSESIRRAPR